MPSAPPPNPKNSTWLPLAVIAGGLAVWGVLLALGAFLAPAGEEAGRDFRKLWVVAATTGGFLLLWGAALVIRGIRLRRRRELKSNEGGSETKP